MGAETTSPTEPIRRTLEVINRLGLHLRAAKSLVETLMPFDAEVTLAYGEKEANGRSILSLATLEAIAGTRVEVTASGPQAVEALAAVEKLFADRFGEPD